MPLDNTTSRFVAGALCPKCGAVDRVVLDLLDGIPQQRRCVACGFVEALSDSDRAHNSGVIPGRLEKTRTTSDATTVVNILPASPAQTNDEKDP